MNRHQQVRKSLFHFNFPRRLRKKTSVPTPALSARSKPESRPDALSRYNRILLAINQIFESMVRTRSEEELGRICLTSAMDVTGGTMGLVGMVGKEGLLHDVAVSGMGGEQRRVTDQPGHRRSPGDPRLQGLYGRVLVDGRSLISNQPSVHPDRFPLPSGHPPLTSFLGVPLMQEGKAIGLLAVANREGGFRMEHQEDLEAIAPAVILALQKKRAERTQEQLEEALRESEKRHRELVLHAPVAIYELDFQKRQITTVNDAMCLMTGYSRDELLTMDPAGLLDEAGQSLFQQRVEQWLRGERPGSVVEYKVRTKDGGLVDALLEVQFLRDEAGRPKGAAVIGYDITERKRSEAALRWSARRYALLSETAACLLQSDDPQSVVNTLCQKVMAFLDCQVFFNYLADPRKGRLQLNAFAGIPEEEARRIEWLDYGQAVCGCAARDGCRILAEDIPGHPDPRTALVASYGVQAYCCHPLTVSGRSIGTLSFGTRSRGRFEPRDVEVMATVADLVAVAMNRVQIENALRESELRFRSVLENSRDVIYRVNLDSGRFEYISPSAERVVGYTAEELLALDLKTSLTMIHPDDRRVLQEAMRRLLETGEVEVEYRQRTKQGDYRWLSNHMSLTLSPTGRPLYREGNVRDITERRQGEERLREADRRKDEFLAILAHELRNPLAPIRNASYLLGQHDLNPEQLRRQQAIIDRQVDHMTRLLNDLLDVSRVTLGRIALKKRTLDLCEVLSQVMESYRPQLGNRRLLLHPETPIRPLWMAGDPDRLAQIFDNLLSNAIKFTPVDGRIEVDMQRVGDEIVVCVRDNGRGIPPELLPKLFELFVQGDRETGAQGGLGIGLTLVKQLTELHLGTVSATSRGPGQGAEFCVKLPTLEEPSDLNTGQAPRRWAGGVTAKVLVVDDLTDAAESLSEVLESWGCRTAMALKGSEALDLFRTFAPDMVLLDLGMPEMNGYEVARRLRRLEPPGQRAILIALTGYGQDQDRRRTEEAGFDTHLVKPVNLEELARLLSSFQTGRT